MTTSESAAEIIEKACSAKNWDVNDYEPFDQEGITEEFLLVVIHHNISIVI
jgi:hypothetical protein